MSIDVNGLLEDFSLEMTAKDVPGLVEAQPLLPAATQVNVSFLANEDLQMRVLTAEAVRNAGMIPVPHLSARRIASPEALRHFLDALRSVGATDNVFVVAGDPAEPEGPYEDALALISAIPTLGSFGIETISISGYPEGHPGISTDVLWESIAAKVAAVTELGTPGQIITQFGFDVDSVVEWIEQVRSRGIVLPIRVGVPGPAGVKRLLGFARRCGVGSSATIAKKYGFSLTNLLGTAGPGRFLSDLADRLDPERHGIVGVHFYTFGGLGTTAEWIREFTAATTSGRAPELEVVLEEG